LLLLVVKQANNIIEKKTENRNSRLVGDGADDDGVALALAVMLMPPSLTCQAGRHSHAASTALLLRR
jgi:hypothetical protein